MVAITTLKKKTIKYGVKAGLGGLIFYVDKLAGARPKELLVLRRKEALKEPRTALTTVTADNQETVYASADTLFKGAVFGRDSLEVAEDLLDKSPELTSNIICKLASLQGTHFNPKTEEEFGKISHEHRHQPSDEVSKLIFDELTTRWGNKDGHLTYYGSVDATPLFIRLVCNYVKNYGPALLAKSINRSGQTITIEQALSDAVSWLLDKLSQSSSGLLEYKALNPQGIENQVWKDSLEFYVHEDGSLVNHMAPIASIEVQGVVFDALLLASQIGVAGDSTRLKQAAFDLREITLASLWLPEHNYFALGLDLDVAGNLRQIKTRAANPAALLDSSIFDDLPTAEQRKYVSAIVQTIMSADFLTEAGIRSRALSMANVISYWDYHGSYTTWPKETNDIARGLRRQGFMELAVQLENRLLNAVKRINSYPEFVYVDDQGNMLTQLVPQHDSSSRVVRSTNKPENFQAWTISSVVRILEQRYGRHLPHINQAHYWKFKLEWKMLEDISLVDHIRHQPKLYKRYPHRPYKLEKIEASEITSLSMGKYSHPA